VSRDAAQIDRIFRRSKLYRPKWDEKHFENDETYGAHTIRTALEKTAKGPESEKKKPEPRANVLEGSLNDRWNGELFAKRHHKDVRFVPQLRAWAAYDSKRWATGGAADTIAEALAKETILSLLDEVRKHPDTERRVALLRRC
jgi:putative DNA primase/helicase